jgi:cold shock CspA family protein
VGVVRGVGMVLKGWAQRAGHTAHQQRVLFGAASSRLLSVGERGGVGGGFNINKKVINNSKRLKGEVTRWNTNRGFGFIRPTDGGEDVLCHFSSITDGSALCEGDMVEYQAEYDDIKGKYMAIKVTAGRNEGGRGGAEQIAIDLNKQILSSDTESLYTIIKTRVADFNHVNVVTALRKALEAPRHLVREEIMNILEESALKNMLSFDPRNTASILHIMAMNKYRPQERLASAIEQQVEATIGEFNSQAVANTL